MLTQIDMEIEANHESPNRPMQRVLDSQPNMIWGSEEHARMRQEGGLPLRGTTPVQPLAGSQGRSPPKPTSYVVAARPGFQQYNDKEDEEDDQNGYDTNDEREQEDWHDDEDEFNPYDKNLDIDVSAHVSHEDLTSSLVHLPKIPKEVKKGMRSETLVVDKDMIASRLIHL